LGQSQNDALTKNYLTNEAPTPAKGGVVQRDDRNLQQRARRSSENGLANHDRSK
jgi:hypothetical protein